MASRLHAANLDIGAVVGPAAAAEFVSFTELYRSLQELESILADDAAAEKIAFPKEPSARYATTIGLTMRAKDRARGYCGFKWLTAKAPAEWIQLFAVDLFKQMRALGQMGAFAGYVARDEQLRKFLTDYQELLGKG